MAFLPTSRRWTGKIRQFVQCPQFDPGSRPASDPDWPRITVITPSYNQAPYLERTILSIHNQGYPNLEHIVIDGGSTDGSLDILRRYQSRFHYWHSKPDGGQSDAINTGAGLATGTLMMWINSDDMLLPGALMRLARAFREDPEADLIYGNQLEVDESDRAVKRLYTIDFDIDDFMYEINIIIHQQSALWRTALFTGIGGLKLYRYAMDYDMVYRMYLAGARFRRIPDFLSAFRVHSTGLTGSGEVSRSRGNEVDAVFRDYLGRGRTPYDRTFMRYRHKMGRFLAEPRGFFAAAEHRIWQWTRGRRRAQGAERMAP